MPPPEPAPHPDHRFRPANECTLLAWSRAALAMIGGGVAVAQFVPELGRAGAASRSGWGCCRAGC